MTKRRKFDRSGNTLSDAYRTEDGASLTFHAPLAVMGHLRWGGLPSAATPLDLDALRRRRDRIRERFQNALILELTNADMIEARKLGDPRITAAQEQRFGEMVKAWREGNISTLSCAAASVLSMNPSHLAAASTLSTLVFSQDISDFDRTMVAGHLSDAFQIDRETEAMRELGDALSRLIRAREGVVWGPFAYSAVRHLMKLEPQETLGRCRIELQERDERSRSLLIKELAEVPGSDVLGLLLHHSRTERSPRLKLQLLGLLDGFLSERRRAEILAEALQNESPSCRWSAIKALRRVRPRVANDLATASLRGEPEKLLRSLLTEAIKATDALAPTPGPAKRRTSTR